VYPYLKLATTLFCAKFRDGMEFTEAGVLPCRVGITDIDLFLELNHARHIAYMEMARWDYGVRVGFVPLMRRRGWAFSIGGISIRYRRSLSLWQKFDVTTLPLCHDGRWLYLLQELLRDGEKCSSALIKAGIVGSSGLVPAPRVLEAIGLAGWDPEMPAWVSAWVAAEGLRPWPKQPA
jgi:acyl-CoA thioesterase FadM